jgi:N-acetyl-anhydromuramyl-L-alanine amidase AmpD
MELKIDLAIRNKWHKGFERPVHPSEIVIHGTGGGGTYSYILNGGRADEYRRGIALFHYLVDRDGTVTEIIDPDRWVYHSSAGRHDSKTIGIELLNPSRANDEEYTDKQYTALGLLLQELMERYTIRVIRGHSRSYEMFNGKTKPNPQCPGNFNWDYITNQLELGEYIYVKGDEEITEITGG